MIRVYTDGSALGNGTTGCIAGIGVWFGEDDPRNVSEKLQGNKQSNGRAELMAAIIALEKTIGQDVEILSDSTYVINSATTWIEGWKKRGWRKAGNKPVENLDLIKRLDQLIREAQGNRQIVWTWVKGHSGIRGNEEADRLADLGCYL